MGTTEVVLAVLGGVAVAASMCWAAVFVAIRLARRRDGMGSRPPGGPRRRAF